MGHTSNILYIYAWNMPKLKIVDLFAKKKNIARFDRMLSQTKKNHLELMIARKYNDQIFVIMVNICV